jgi:hypothetical protein
VGYLHEIIHKVLSYLNKNLDIELQKYQEKMKTTEQKDPYYVDAYPVTQVKAYTSSDLNIIKENFYMMYNFLTYIWKSMIFDLPEHIQDCTDEHLTTYFIVQLMQQGIMMDIIIARGPRKNENLNNDKSNQIGISNLINSELKRKLRDFPDYQIIPWLHPGRAQCRIPYYGKYGKYMKEYAENNEYEASLQCGISVSVQFILYMYLISIAFSGTNNPKIDVRLTLISAIMVLVGDGGHNIREIITGFTLSIIMLRTFMRDLKKELREVTGKTKGEFINFNSTEIPDTELCSKINIFIKFRLKVKSENYDQELRMDYFIHKILIKQEDQNKVLGIKEKSLFIFNQLLISFGNWETYVNEFYDFTKNINPLGVYADDLNKYDTSILKSKTESLDNAKQVMYNAIFIQNVSPNIENSNMTQIFFALEGNRYELDPNSSFKYYPNNLVNKALIELSNENLVRHIPHSPSYFSKIPYFKDVLADVNKLVQAQLDKCNEDISSINIPLAFKSTYSRRSPKRKSPKRKSPKRKSPKRKSNAQTK